MTRGPVTAVEDRSPARQALCDLLLDKIREDRYPSATMMYIVESQLTDEELPAYAEVLLEKVQDDRFPSIDMIRHILALT